MPIPYMKGTKQLFILGAIILASLSTVGFVGLQSYTSVTTIEDNVEIEKRHVVDVDGKLVNEDGQEIYMTRCLSCHMSNGEGVQGVFPPLANSEHVNGDKGVLVRMILHGLRGEIVVNDVTYNGMMPPWGGFLNDQQVADVITYIRSNFGNDADAVTAEEVAIIRAAVGERNDAWTMDELKLPENQGIPEGE